MSIWNALHSGVSGLHTHGLALGVVGDNIANVNTAGFKRARAVFGDMLSAFLPTTRGAAQLGRGVMLLGIEQLHSQGTQLQTENPLDMSIVGNGFFVVRGTHSGVTGNFFTRAGQFHLDEDGYLVNMDRLRVQGYARAPSGNLVTTRTLGDLRLGGITIPPEKTTTVDVTAALNPNDAQRPLFDPTDPDATATFSHDHRLGVGEHLQRAVAEQSRQRRADGSRDDRVAHVDIDPEDQLRRGQHGLEAHTDARVDAFVADHGRRDGVEAEDEAVADLLRGDVPHEVTDRRFVVVGSQREQVDIASGTPQVERGEEHPALEHQTVAMWRPGEPREEALQGMDLE